MKEQFTRTEMLLGEEGLEKLHKVRVAVFGVGGVGGFVVEALARAGVGTLDIIDNDEVDITNLNRQIIALHSTLGRPKVEVAEERIKDINPYCKVNVYRTFYLPETQNEFDFTQYDYVVDAIDTVTGKLALICQARDAGVPIISSMGTGNKLDPTALRVADIYDTSVCPLAKVMRRECRKRGIERLKVVYSVEEAMKPKTVNSDTDGSETDATSSEEGQQKGRRSTPGSVSFVPSVAGLIIASEVVKDIIA